MEWPQLASKTPRMNDHLSNPGAAAAAAAAAVAVHLGSLTHPLADPEMDAGHAETTEVLLSLLSQNKALSGKIIRESIIFCKCA